MYLLPILTAFLFCFFAVQFVKPLAFKVGLVDKPNARKHHTGSIPLIGGVAIYIGVLTTVLLFFKADSKNIYIFSSTVILLLGILDDRFDLSVKLRILVQCAVASAMILGAGLYIESLGRLFYFFELELGILGSLVTVVAVIAAINAFNMVDGIDGLAGALSAISFSVIAILLFAVGNEWYLLAALYVSAILAFLMFNLRWPKRSLGKVFMGDAGSMLIGLTIIWLLVIGVDTDVEAFRPVTALYIIAVPLMDMVAIMYRRVKKGASPFKPDRDHLHHIFERAGFSRKQSLLYISFIALSIAFLGVLMEIYLAPEWLMFTIFIVMFSIYNVILSRVWRIISWIRHWRSTH